MRNASAAKKEGNEIKKRKSKQERRFFLLGLLFVSPWLIGFLCFQLYPILSALYYSLRILTSSSRQSSQGWT
ncbi:sugar ABC transporter permease, partial [Ruthenibacterium lactatiformans]|nr:sugar ABC transporter permease [Ruthenibacterium lactatiformans]